MARKIAIVGGTGAEGSGLAYRLAKAGEHTLIGSRDAARATLRKPSESRLNDIVFATIIA